MVIGLGFKNSYIHTYIDIYIYIMIIMYTIFQGH